MIKTHPLKSSFMFFSIIGFFISSFYIINYSLDWGFAFASAFVIMFISSVVSMSRVPIGDEEHYRELAVHERKYEQKVKKLKKRK
ncbi:hypothetical protein JW949_04500 [Candidatus Woesearchaeota archaeon]|nr:hypothetical protein [Candidatus Woesearchaeota archaeon]